MVVVSFMFKTDLKANGWSEWLSGEQAKQHIHTCQVCALMGAGGGGGRGYVCTCMLL